MPAFSMHEEGMVLSSFNLSHRACLPAISPVNPLNLTIVEWKGASGGLSDEEYGDQ